jgi:hypothetical protein
MQAQELKEMVECGLYKPNPSEIAAAMLQRRGVRDLLTEPESRPVNGSAGRTLAAPALPRRAA